MNATLKAELVSLKSYPEAKMSPISNYHYLDLLDMMPKFH
ncbi:hypothetical protein NIES3974_07960 [Calothrix sp. NIES-3974]|nr:hypothetical protein NIES3974_07960 [Calothrix sp. NIES-3974]